MSRLPTSAAPQAPSVGGRARRPELLDDAELDEIERRYVQGITSREIVDLFTSRGIRFSEATLRKYVQLGLLPRSVRVGRKGKHQGSRGLYPANVVRRVNLVKGLMAENRTIEEIQQSLMRFKDDIEEIESGLRELMSGFEREARSPALEAERRADLEREIVNAKRMASELVGRIMDLERRISSRASRRPGAAVGGGDDLF
jgi:DNA-binding transcriptional MerR regulator